MVHPRVLQALSAPVIGHLDPAFLALMSEVQERLRRVFRTRNPFTIAVSGTGSAGMEAALVNLVEPGDRVLVGVNGVFGARMAAVVERCGGTVLRVDAPWGRIVEPDDVRRAVERAGPVKAVALVHAETSTGVHQPLESVGVFCRERGILFVVDAVTSLSGLPVETDGWGIDVCYSGTQKCLSCPPGLAPLTVSDRALAAITRRQRPCVSWYLDLALIADYWAEQSRAYHHTAPISMLYALREALCLVEEEGLSARIARHRLHSAALTAGLAALGFTPFAQAGHRLTTLHCMLLPPGWDDGAIRAELLDRYAIEVGAGLGAIKGTAWRIGLMGESSTRAHVLTLLHALEDIGARRGLAAASGEAIAAATAAYASAEPCAAPA